MNKHHYAVIMAGGIGSRFWPVSTADRPKQFIDILGTGKSLLRQTFERISGICPAENIFVVTNKSYRELTAGQLPELKPDRILCESQRKNTAPCLAYANLRIGKIDPSASILVAPSDHLIEKEDVFIALAEKALARAQANDVLLTIGIRASRPDTGYGYIKYESSVEEFKKVKSFTEKPDLERAKKFLASGDYSWNAGIFIWSIQSIGKAFKNHLPEMYNLFEKGRDKAGTKDEQDFADEVYKQCEAISIDYGILEKAANVEVINGDFGWSDLGTWGSLYTHLDQDANKNAITGENVMVHNSHKNLIRSSGDRLVVTQGLDGFIVIDDGKTLLICRMEEEQEIKKIAESQAGKA